MMQYQYQVDFGSGRWENVFPDFYGITEDQEEDPQAWLDYLRQEGVAVRARVLFGGNEVERESFS